MIVLARRLLVAFVIGLAVVGGACILGPKQDDPSSDQTGLDSGLGIDAASADGGTNDTRVVGSDAPHYDTTPVSDTSATDTTSSDVFPPSDGGDAADAPMDALDDALDDGSATDGGSAGDGSVE